MEGGIHTRVPEDEMSIRKFSLDMRNEYPIKTLSSH